MSSYERKTKHPLTGEFEVARWLDDWFGPHRYGVKFSDGNVFKDSDYEWEFEEEKKDAG